MTDKPREYMLAHHPDDDPEFMDSLGYKMRANDQSPRGRLAHAISQFPAQHRSWSIEALESIRGSYSLADYLLEHFFKAAADASGNVQERK